MKIKKRYFLSLLTLVILGCVAVYFLRFRERGPSGPTPAEIVKELLEFDKNGDGKLSADEVPERMQGLFARGDANQDSVLSQDELRKLAEAQSEAARRNQHNDQREGERR